MGGAFLPFRGVWCLHVQDSCGVGVDEKGGADAQDSPGAVPKERVARVVAVRQKGLNPSLVRWPKDWRLLCYKTAYKSIVTVTSTSFEIWRAKLELSDNPFRSKVIPYYLLLRAVNCYRRFNGVRVANGVR